MAAEIAATASAKRPVASDANDAEIDQMLESAKKLDVLLKSAKEKTRP